MKVAGQNANTREDNEVRIEVYLLWNMFNPSSMHGASALFLDQSMNYLHSEWIRDISFMPF